MTDKLHAYLADQKKLHNPSLGPNLKENGFVDKDTSTRERRRPDPPSPSNYIEVSTKNVPKNSTTAETSTGRGGGRGRGARGGRGARPAGRGGRGGRVTNNNDPKPDLVEVSTSVTRGKRGKATLDVLSEKSDISDNDPNEEPDTITKKAKVVDGGSPTQLTNTLNTLYSRLESMADQHKKEIERVEQNRLSDITKLLEKQAAMEREIEFYKTNTLRDDSPSLRVPSPQNAPPPHIITQHAPPPQSIPPHVPVHQHCLVQPQTAPLYAAVQAVPQVPQTGVSLSQYVATLRSLSMRGEEHNLLLSVLKERDILESSIATFGNLTFPPPPK